MSGRRPPLLLNGKAWPEAPRQVSRPRSAPKRSQEYYGKAIARRRQILLDHLGAKCWWLGKEPK